MNIFKRKLKPVDPPEETEDIYNSDYYDISLQKEQSVASENEYDEDFPSTIEKIQPAEVAPEEDEPKPEVEPAEEIEDTAEEVEEVEKIEEIEEAEEEKAPQVSVYAPEDNFSCQPIVEDLKNGGIVIIDTSKMDTPTILRTFDFIMGAVFALDSEIIRPDSDTVVVGPKGMDLEEFCDTYGEQDDTEE